MLYWNHVTYTIGVIKEGNRMYIKVHNNNIERALSTMKRRMQDEGLFKEMRQRKQFEKPSDKRRRLHQVSVMRQRRATRLRLEREGY